jgi:transposase
LVRGRPQQVLAVENIVARQRGSRLSSHAIKCLTPAGVVELGLGADVTLALKTNVAMIGEFTVQIARLEQRLREGVKPREEHALLRTVPGIGETLATIIQLEVGDIARFPGPGNFASYARGVDSARYSNGKKRRQITGSSAG